MRKTVEYRRRAGWPIAVALDGYPIYGYEEPDGGATGKLDEFGGHGFGKFKPALGQLLVEQLAPINARFLELRADRAALGAILRQGAEKARALAAPTLAAARAVVSV